VASSAFELGDRADAAEWRSILANRWCSVLFVTGLPPTFVALAGFLVLAWPSRDGRASELPEGLFTFTWDAPAECASRDQVLLEIAHLLGGRIQIVHGGDLDARATVERGVAWSVSLTTRHAGRAGQRSIEAPSCKSVAEATALILALMIDPDAVAANSQERKEGPAAGPTPSVPVASPGDATVDWLAGAHVQVSSGTLPDLDVGMGVGVQVSGRRWRAELRGTYGLRRNQINRLPAGEGAYGQFNITTGAMTGCYSLGRPGLGFGPCVVAEAGVVSAEGHGASVGFDKRAPWIAIGAGGFLSIAMGQHLRGSAEIDVLFPLYRPAYIFQDLAGVVFRAPIVGGRLLAGIEWRF
jgi:hypothetical protein